MTLREIVKKPKFILKGLATHIPTTVAQYLPRHETQFAGLGARTEERQYDSMNDYARSCYTNWLRVLVSLDDNGVHGPFKCVGELGPGDTIGTALCAILSGSNKCFALDIVPTISLSKYSNAEMLEEIITLFKNREPIPDDSEFPKNIPKLSSYEFPSHILTDELLTHSLSDARLKELRELVRSFETESTAPNTGSLSIKYLVPWNSSENLDTYANEMDLIVSYAVMEHVDDVQKVYNDQWHLLKDGGTIAHAMDFKCHHTAGLWNGHWTYSDLTWKIIYGRCAYLINRWPHSWHIHAMTNIFTVLCDEVNTKESTLLRNDLAATFRGISDSDLVTHTAFIAGNKLPRRGKDSDIAIS